MNSKYGFNEDEIVLNKIPLTDEDGQLIPENTKLRIVSIPPKVRYTNKDLIKTKPKENDSKLYFVNLVRAESDKDYPRFREHFVVIKKCPNF